MKFDIAALFEQIIGMYTRMPFAQKVALPLIFAASMGAIVFVSRWGSRPDYGVLFSGLEDSDAAQVVEQLKTKKIGFRLRDDGHTIDVTPPDSVHQLRLELMATGVPKGGKAGIELFSESSLGRTRFAEELLGIQAMQGELERTIKSINSVEHVRVHITKPKRSVFAKRDILPTASVLIRLKTGESLTRDQLKGISNLVAGAVEGLDAKSVSIIDEKGRLLNVATEEDAIGGGGDSPRMEYQNKFEKGLEQQVESMLTEILGPNKAVARITAELDFSKREQSEENYDPAGAVALSERVIEEGGNVNTQGGVTGVLSNLTNQQGLLNPPNSTNNGSSKREITRNYQVSHSKSVVVGASGSVKRLTVAVLVDGQYRQEPAAVAESAEATPIRTYEPLSAEMLAKIDGLVKQAVGYDSARGDTVTVENLRFFEPDTSLADVFNNDRVVSQAIQVAPYLLQGLGLLLFFMVLLRPIIKFLVNPPDAEVDLTRLLPAGVGELQTELEAERARATALPEPEGPSVDIEQLESLMGENSRMVQQNPEQAALLIRYWLNESHS